MDTEPPSIFFILFSTYPFFSVLLFFVLIVLLLSSALISGAEVAFFSLTKRHLQHAKEIQFNGIETIETLLKNQKKLLATILITNNFINVAIVILSSYLCREFLQFPDFTLFGFTFPSQFIIEIMGITFLILLFGEILPKVYANKKALQFSAFTSKPILILQKIFSPLSSLLLNSTNFIEEKLNQKKESLSVDQLSQALELTTESDNKEDQEDQKILEGIVTFGNTDTKQVMTPRVDMFTLKTDTPFDEIIQLISDNGFSRIPVYTENIDSIEGILYAKDLIPYINQENYNWVQILRKPYFVPENKKLDDLLNDFKEKKVHIAIVVDEYGGTSGIISLEDIIEEIVGEISDEFDDEDILYSKIDENNYTFEGKTSLKDFYKVLEIEEDLFEDAKGESDTLAGFIIEINGQFPKQRQKIIFNNYTFTIEALDKKRIKQIKVTIHHINIDED
ncbi:MAG: gliding motility-associated protein GldE [Flavobacteriales bacterium]